jgi:hypothetical protein
MVMKRQLATSSAPRSRWLDIFELVPSGLMSQNETDAAKLVHFDFLNVQGQPKLVWPLSFVVAQSSTDAAKVRKLAETVNKLGFAQR